MIPYSSLGWIFGVVGLSFCAVSGCSPTRTIEDDRAAMKSSNRESNPGELSQVSSCSATQCHGAARSSDDEWESAYTAWTKDDPHSQAYLTLLNRRSRDIVARLHPPAMNDEIEYIAYLRKSCLACHATNVENTVTMMDGVTCMSCHGEGLWTTEHAMDAWVDLTFEQRAQRGFHDTRNLARRARVCVECHVAPSSAESQADVNHDLIGAGHPRLMFEFSAYFAALPRHWDEVNDTRFLDAAKMNPRSTEFETEAWLVGQLVSSRRLLEQLAARAVSKSDSTSVWPELAEYSCLDCHHDLDANRLELKSHTQGKPDWGSWIFPLLALSEARNANSLSRALLELNEEMDRFHSDRRKVQRLANDALEHLAAFQPVAEWADDTTGKLLLTIANAPIRVDRWEEVTHWYAALKALVAGFDVPQGQVDSVSSIQAELAALFRLLQPSLGYEFPAEYSPALAESRVQRLRHEIRRLLERG